MDIMVKKIIDAKYWPCSYDKFSSLSIEGHHYYYFHDKKRQCALMVIIMLCYVCKMLAIEDFPGQ